MSLEVYADFGFVSQEDYLIGLRAKKGAARHGLPQPAIPERL